MLQTQSVEAGTFSLLKELLEIPALSEFALVGGTALALHLGHRKSVDIDLFSPKPFDNIILAQTLKEHFPNIQIGNTANKIGLFCFINDIKVDFVRQEFHPLLNPVTKVDGIRMFSLEDIAAMKIFAMLQRPKKKDHWDIAELLQRFSLEDIIGFYLKKYPANILIISIPKALVYTDDVEQDEDPVSLNGKKWSDIKKIIAQKVDNYLKY